MNKLKDILVIIASLGVIVFISDSFSTKYNTDTMGLSCTNNSVEETLLEVTTSKLEKSFLKEGYILSSSVIKDNTSTEERKLTIGDKSKFTCNTTISFQLKADSKNAQAVNYINKTSNNTGILSATLDRDFTITENDLGTQYWVQAMAVTAPEINILFK